MAKLVVLSEGMTGKAIELAVDKTTIGRVDDNTFPLPEPSISSHHCEVLLRGSDIVIKDLNSTNGTFINNQQITGEAVLRPGQILKLGKVELRLETPESAAAAATSTRKSVDQTLVIPRGVSLNELEQGPKAGGFDSTSAAFSKKENKVNKWFIIGGVIISVIILSLLVFIMMMIKK